MAKVSFPKDGITAEAPVGSMLIDVCDKNGASILFACRTGTCLTCLSTISKGTELLSPIEESEKMTLEAAGAPPEKRLVCQCKIISEGEIEIVQD